MYLCTRSDPFYIVIISNYYYSFWCSNFPLIGYSQPIQADFCVFLTYLHHPLSMFLLSVMTRYFKLSVMTRAISLSSSRVKMVLRSQYLGARSVHCYCGIFLLSSFSLSANITTGMYLCVYVYTSNCINIYLCTYTFPVNIHMKTSFSLTLFILIHPHITHSNLFTFCICNEHVWQEKPAFIYL